MKISFILVFYFLCIYTFCNLRNADPLKPIYWIISLVLKYVTFCCSTKGTYFSVLIATNWFMFVVRSLSSLTTGFAEDFGECALHKLKILTWLKYFQLLSVNYFYALFHYFGCTFSRCQVVMVNVSHPVLSFTICNVTFFF